MIESRLHERGEKGKLFRRGHGDFWHSCNILYLELGGSYTDISFVINCTFVFFVLFCIYII